MSNSPPERFYIDVLRDLYRADPGQEVVVGKSRWTLPEFGEDVVRMARGLYDLGLRPGSTVATLLPTGIDAMASFFALSMLGCVAVPISVRLKTDEAAYLLGDAQVDAVLLTTEHEHRVPVGRLIQDVVAEYPAAAPKFAVDLNRAVTPAGAARPGWLHGREALDQDFDDLSPEWSAPGPAPEPVTLLYSSGSTAQPKGVILHETQMVRKSQAWAGYFAGLERGDRLWNPLPFFHVGGISVLLAAFLAEATYLTDVFFQAEAALEQIEAEGATFLWPGFTTILYDLVRSPRFAQADLGSVRAIGAAGPPEVLTDLQRHFPSTPMVTVYGTTETGGIVTVTRRDDPEPQRLTTTGRPLPGLELRIDRSDGRETSTDGEMTAGEILVRGYSTCTSYYRKPEQTAELLAGDGWIRTGDLGWLDGDGWLHFAGRLKDIVRAGGENISAAELEAVLNTHEAVVLTQVIAIPHQRLGEVPVAFVELHTGREVSEEELLEHCRTRLARFKWPARVIAVTEWPMSSTKVQKFKLRELVPDVAQG
ncbi:class I adenylate-forming enzyme family protein [Dactylosporangium sp. CA-092794]|uniref:class I adenylate-forming enzyme family protein n=1 Tax=Dactylosporangium sp. CA-092794 TaxID=3239929 RepID=UPI003D902A54